MGRIYIRVFLIFWVATTILVIGSSVAIHLYNLGPDKHFSSQDSKDPGDRFLRELVSEAINYDYQQVELGLKAMPAWSTRYFFIINENGDDMLGRNVPPIRRLILEQLSAEKPYFKGGLKGKLIYARRFQLNDGHNLRVISFPPIDQTFNWRLFLYNFWSFLLPTILISGAGCLYLARYLTADIKTLTNATQRLAKGDWNVRISDHFGKHPGEIAELGAAFDNMAFQLRQSMLEQKRLIKDVSHELRSPLARLQVALAIAQQRANPEVQPELERIKSAADYLNDVISDILSLPINEEGEWELADVVELNSLINVVIESCKDEASEKNVSLKITSEVDETLVMTRGNTLFSVLDNIVHNALHHTNPNTAITVKLKLNSDNNPEISVSDQGPGVDEQHINDIFKPFFRTDEARDRSSGGYGLGLSIAHRTVLLHGGNIYAANNKNAQGLTVTFNIPAAPMDNDDLA